MLAGATQALGMVGAVIGQVPISIAVRYFGWRHAMWLVSILFIILAIAIFFIVQDKPKEHTDETEESQEKKIPILQSLMIVIKNPQSWGECDLCGLCLCAGCCFW